MVPYIRKAPSGRLLKYRLPIGSLIQKWHLLSTRSVNSSWESGRMCLMFSVTIHIMERKEDVW